MGFVLVATAQVSNMILARGLAGTMDHRSRFPSSAGQSSPRDWLLSQIAEIRQPAFTSAPPSSSHSLRTESHITIALELRVRQLRAEGVILDGGRRARRQTNINLDVPANGPAQ